MRIVRVDVGIQNVYGISVWSKRFGPLLFLTNNKFQMEIVAQYNKQTKIEKAKNKK